MDFSDMNYRELQAECKKYGLKASGKKDSLIESLKAFLAQGQPSATTNTDESTASDMENVPSEESEHKMTSNAAAAVTAEKETSSITPEAEAEKEEPESRDVVATATVGPPSAIAGVEAEGETAFTVVVSSPVDEMVQSTSTTSPAVEPKASPVRATFSLMEAQTDQSPIARLSPPTSVAFPTMALKETNKSKAVASPMMMSPRKGGMVMNTSASKQKKTLSTGGTSSFKSAIKKPMNTTTSFSATKKPTPTSTALTTTNKPSASSASSSSNTTKQAKPVTYKPYTGKLPPYGDSLFSPKPGMKRVPVPSMVRGPVRPTTTNNKENSATSAVKATKLPSSTTTTESDVLKKRKVDTTTSGKTPLGSVKRTAC